MRPSLRRQLRFLRAYAALNTLVLVVLATTAFRQSTAIQKFDEINAQRINIVDADGTLRMVISNKDRMHPGVIDGKTIDRPRPVAGMLFFNDEGDEVGGLTFTGREANGTRQANASLMFDQLKQDQTIGFSYSEGSGRRTAGFQVWDRSDTRLGDLIDKLNAANKIADKAERDAAVAKIRAAALKIRCIDWRMAVSDPEVPALGRGAAGRPAEGACQGGRETLPAGDPGNSDAGGDYRDGDRAARARHAR